RAKDDRTPHDLRTTDYRFQDGPTADVHGGARPRRQCVSPTRRCADLLRAVYSGRRARSARAASEFRLQTGPHLWHAGVHDLRRVEHYQSPTVARNALEPGNRLPESSRPGAGNVLHIRGTRSIWLGWSVQRPREALWHSRYGDRYSWRRSWPRGSSP